MASLHLVIMAGGSGTRFWPKSTSQRPKQLLSFGGDGSPTLLQETLSRFDGLVPRENAWIVTTEALKPAIVAQAAHAHVLGEPQARNTAPCVYWAARKVAAQDPEAIMLVMPSDHHMADLPAFRRTVERAAKYADTHDELVTLGVKPARAETGYGYLELGDDAGDGATRVAKFVEKPNLETAEKYVSSGRYLWNGGMFLWKARVILAAFDRFMPEMKAAWEAQGGDPIRAYPHLTATSIDFGVMEKARNVVTFPLDCGWDDLGSWTSLETLATSLGLARDGGVVTGGEMVAVESSGNIVDAPGSWVALLGVKDLIVARNGEAILVAHKDRAQDIRKIVDAIRSRKPDLA